jgi:eukaryotic-like serine/threonine-protein kinase
MANRVGEQIGLYKLLRLLGTGGNSGVYLVEHVHNKEQYAIKIFNSMIDNSQISAYATELRALARLSHPNIVQIVEFGENTDDINDHIGRPYLVMTFAPNGTLRERHPKGTQVPLQRIVGYVNRMADALDYAHEQDVIHRDIKPENILLGQNNEILLSDFGIAAIVTTRISWDREVWGGTFYYMAPEQIEGHPHIASDQYALGIVVYEWLCGRPPFNGTYLELLAQHLSAPPPSFEKTLNIAPHVQRVVMKALNKNPQERYPTVKEFARALESEERTTTMLSSPVPYPEEKRPTAPSPSAPEAPPFNVTPTSPNVLPNPQNVYRDIQVLPSTEQKEILIKAFGSLSVKDKEEIVQETGIRPLSQQATDFIWKVVVLGVVIVFVGSAVGVTLAVFVGANVAPLITVFTAVIALLGGLLAPSPVQNVIRSLSSNFKSSSKADRE